MSNANIKKVVIVGGGTAGWMAAAALGKLLGKNLDISLVESDQIGTVGVGEATIPLLSAFHQLLGISEQDFMRATQATFKLGIQFENWGAIGDRYIHGFGIIGQDCWACSFHHFWAKSRLLGNRAVLADYSLHRHAANAGKFKLDLEKGLAYAYHLDATRYAQFLRQFSEKQGVKRIEGKIVDVATSAEDGSIDHITLESGDKIAGEFYIDCSGFRALLIEGALQTGYEDWTHWLPCDRAFAVQTKSVGPPVPYTRSIAHEAGWQWRIPLQHRVGNGHVFCSQYISDEAAERTLRDNIKGDLITEPRLIRFRTGRRTRQWHKNCVSLGLASGFLEPLESTSIHLVQSGIIRLMQLFPTHRIDPTEVDEYNTQSRLEFEYIRDFIIMHYHVTERDDSPFWNYCRTMSIPDSLARRLNLFRSNGRIFRENFELFFDGSWSQVMTGQRLIPEGYHPIVDLMSGEELRSFLNNITSMHNKTVAGYPSHQDFLANYCRAGNPD
ncbi:MAG: tryptophan halogenase family protein [Woeseia sp.]